MALCQPFFVIPKMKYQPAYLEQGSLPKGATVFKTMDPTIEVSDFVVVPTDTRHGMTVCQVVATDFEIDYENTAECHWIIGKVDTTEFEDNRQKEAEALAQVKAAAHNKRRKELAEQLIGQLDPDSLKNIPMLSAPPQPERGDEPEGGDGS